MTFQVGRHVAVLRLWCIHAVLYAWCQVHTTAATVTLFGQDELDMWWSPTDFGSPELVFTTTYFDPYRIDTSRFYPFVYGYVSSNAATDIGSFEECMQNCITDASCFAFEINMLFLPFQCRFPVDPCPDGQCAAFTPDANWRHFVKQPVFRDDTTPQTGLQPLSLSNPGPGLYEYKDSHQSQIAFFVQKILDASEKNWEYVEIKIMERSLAAPSIPYVWFEYKAQSTSAWIKCRKIPFPISGIPRYYVRNLCLDYDFRASYTTSMGRGDDCPSYWKSTSKQKCEKLKESWTKFHISPQSKKVGDIWVQPDNGRRANDIWLDCCENALTQDPGHTTADPKKLRLRKVDDMYAIRFVSLSWKIDDVLEIGKVHTASRALLNNSYVITQFGDDQFVFPSTTTAAQQNDPRNAVKDWYFNITRDGGQLFCHKPLPTPSDTPPVTNVFQRMHHVCYHKGSTWSAERQQPGTGNQRSYRFRADECTFPDITQIPNCTKAWVDIVEDCDSNRWCLQTLTHATNITFYHKGGVELYGNTTVDLPIVEWNSTWDRAADSFLSLPFSLDYYTQIFLILHDCLPNAQFADEFHGCSQCNSSYFEAHYNPSITIDNLRLYSYNPSAQYCRPQPPMYEELCDQKDQRDPFYCPKGWYWIDQGANTLKEFKRMKEFEHANSWSCRTAFHDDQQVVDANSVGLRSHAFKDVLAQQGFGCYINQNATG